MDIPYASLVWIGRSKDDYVKFPRQVQRKMGFWLFEAENGEHPSGAKPLKGFGGASVIELISDFDGDTYRAVYTVKLSDTICVLHCFQKKSSSGRATSKQDLDTIKERLAIAVKEHGK